MALAISVENTDLAKNINSIGQVPRWEQTAHMKNLKKVRKARLKPVQVVVSPPPALVPKVPQTPYKYVSGPLSNAQMQFLGNCESGMNPTTNTGNGFYGAFQFTIPTWNAMGTGYARADLAPLSVQISAVQKLLSSSSIFTQFPGCANKMRANGLI